MLPSSVIPFFWVASSRSVMGVYKVSYFVEFFALIMFIGILGLKIIFLVEMMFGNCDWAVRLGWDVGSISLSYIVLLIAVSTLLCLMIWLAATPLKSASSRLDALVWNWDINNVPDSSAERHERHYSKTRYGREESTQKQEPSVGLGNSLESHPNVLLPNSDLNLPETLLDADTIPYMTTIGDNDYNITFPIPTSYLEESSAPVETGEVSTVCSEGSVSERWRLSSRRQNQLTCNTRSKGYETGCVTGVDSKFDPKPTPPLKVDASVKEFTGYFPSIGGKGSDSPMNSSIYDSPNLLGVQGSISSSWSSCLQFSEAYAENSNHNAFDAGERRYSSLRLPPSSESNDYQPATVHVRLHHTSVRLLKKRVMSLMTTEMPIVSRNVPLQSETHHLMIFALLAGPAENLSNALKIQRNSIACQTYQGSFFATGNQVGSPLAFDNLSLPNHIATHSPCSAPDQTLDPCGLSSHSNSLDSLETGRFDWLFRQNDGADEDLIDRVTAKERFLYEAEAREMNRLVHMVEPQYSLDRKPGSALKNDDIDYSNFLVSSVPHCRDGYVWRMDLTISFGVWCNHRILDLSLTESRPELWGKYTYVLQVKFSDSMLSNCF
ncbi:NRAMP metal ion transporter family protein [Actinidia rufa]|uniref:NRAMP metal ion transporter family protein n=1 Tax=Actinidia rufa TaxID=165716 RepID=A0A7J0G882_9ERIC|nr:NRAMP metal ion transporter family protein [Actinidia rufa]